MDERVIQFRIGVMVLATSIITGILLVMFGGHQNIFRFWGRQVFYVRFPEAPGVSPGTPVERAGIRIGRVTEIQFPEDLQNRQLKETLKDYPGVVVTIQIDRGRRIYRDEVCRIRRDDLLGDAVLVFVRAGRQAGPEAGDPPGNPNSPGAETQGRQAVKPGELLVGEIETSPFEMVRNLEEDVTKAVHSIAQTSDKIGRVADSVNALLGGDEDLEDRRKRFSDMMETAQSTMEAIGVLVDNVNDVIGDEQFRGRLKEGVAEAPEILRDARDTLAQIREALDGMDETVGLLNRNLRNVEGFTGSLDEQGRVVLDRLSQGAEKLDLLLGEAHAFTQALNSQKGTLGQLVHNPELYDNLNQAVATIEDLTRQLRPVVRDARVFSDKIARHPELLGVRGAIQRNPGTKGVPRVSQLLETSDPAQPGPSWRLSPPR